jgi:cytochrome b involved in lipid metabolism
MNKTVRILIGSALILGVAVFVLWQKQVNDMQYQGTPSTGTETQTPGTPGTPATTSQGITLADVAKHADAQSCWSAINGNVYDLTAWIPQHPGGPDKILQICGIDGSAKFNAQHGGAQLQQQILAGFKIGTLAK